MPRNSEDICICNSGLYDIWLCNSRKDTQYIVKAIRAKTYYYDASHRRAIQNRLEHEAHTLETLSAVELLRPYISCFRGFDGELAMDCIDGITLYEWMDIIKPSIHQFAKVLLNTCEILEKLEIAFPGFRHGDLSPYNVMVNAKTLHVSLIDFEMSGTIRKSALSTYGRSPALFDLLHLCIHLIHSITFPSYTLHRYLIHWMTAFCVKISTTSAKWYEKYHDQIDCRELRLFDIRLRCRDDVSLADAIAYLRGFVKN
jgi:tRNA A-37 threonylcarbamoyl transferase component Bud32